MSLAETYALSDAIEEAVRDADPRYAADYHVYVSTFGRARRGDYYDMPVAHGTVEKVRSTATCGQVFVEWKMVFADDGTAQLLTARRGQRGWTTDDVVTVENAPAALMQLVLMHGGAG